MREEEGGGGGDYICMYEYVCSRKRGRESVCVRVLVVGCVCVSLCRCVCGHSHQS